MHSISVDLSIASRWGVGCVSLDVDEVDSRISTLISCISLYCNQDVFSKNNILN